MNLALRKPMTLAEFLQWEERQELRYEFDGTGPVAMTGGTDSHDTIQGNLWIQIGGRLQDTPCRFHGNDLKFQVASGNIRYTDGMVICPPFKKTKTVAFNPTIVFEVLSRTTADKDRIVKAGEYQATPSVQRYVILEQDFIGGTVVARSGETWTDETLTPDSLLSLPEIGVTLPLAALYKGVDFELEQADDRSVDSEAE